MSDRTKRKLPEPFTREWLRDGFNALTAEEARDLIFRTEDGKFGLDHIRSYVKGVIGKCVDEDSSAELRAELWKIADMLTIVKLAVRSVDLRERE